MKTPQPPPAWLIRLAEEHPRLWLEQADMTAEELLVRVREGRSLAADRPAADIAALLRAT
jgi:hypothetical protein